MLIVEMQTTPYARPRKSKALKYDFASLLATELDQGGTRAKGAQTHMQQVYGDNLDELVTGVYTEVGATVDEMLAVLTAGIFDSPKLSCMPLQARRDGANACMPESRETTKCRSLLNKTPANQLDKRKRLTKQLRDSIGRDDTNRQQLIIEQLVESTKRGDKRRISLLLGQLKEKKRRAAVQPSVDEQGNRFHSQQDKTDFWGRYLQEKYEEVTAEEHSRVDIIEQLDPIATPENPDGRDPCIDLPTFKEIDDAINRLKDGTAAGVDRLGAEVFKNSPRARHYMALLVRRIFLLEIVPRDLPIGRVCMVHKPGKDKNDPRNYRPITVTSVVYRVVMSVVHRRTLKSIERYVRDSQYGSRPGRRCAGALSAISTVVREVMSAQGMPYNSPPGSTTVLDDTRASCHTFMLAVDYRGAFDSVSQRALLASLMDAGVDHKTLSIIADVYSKARVFAQTKDLAGNPHESTMVNVNRGVVQGDPFSATAFINLVEWMMREFDKLMHNPQVDTTGAAAAAVTHTSEDIGLTL
jgi:hypothetical protein